MRNPWKYILSMTLLCVLTDAAHAADRVKVVFDKTHEVNRIRVSPGNLVCSPGNAKADFGPWHTRLRLDMYRVKLFFNQFSHLPQYIHWRDERKGDFCAEHKQKFAGKKEMKGTARRVVTEHHGWRYGRTCWRFFREVVTLKINGYVFKTPYSGFEIGGVDPKFCR